MYTDPFAPPPNSQYDPDSAPDQNVNCGPTTVTNVCQFMVDRDFPIEQTRALATSSHYRGTTTSERKIMLDRRGVPSSVRHLSAAQVKAFLNGHRTMDLALRMGLIPISVRVRPFPGSHSVEAIANSIRGGETGIMVFNPDFRRGLDAARYFYADRFWIPAFNALGGWAVVPDKDKVFTKPTPSTPVPTRSAFRKSCRTVAGVNLRSGPGTQYTVVKLVPAGFAFTSIQLENAGGAYVAGGVTRRDWMSLSLNGRLVWVARGFVTVL